MDKREALALKRTERNQKYLHTHTKYVKAKPRITQEIINRAKPNDSAECALAEALSRAIPIPNPEGYDGLEWRVTGVNTERTCSYTAEVNDHRIPVQEHPYFPPIVLQTELACWVKGFDRRDMFKGVEIRPVELRIKYVAIPAIGKAKSNFNITCNPMSDWKAGQVAKEFVGSSGAGYDVKKCVHHTVSHFLAEEPNGFYMIYIKEDI